MNIVTVEPDVWRNAKKWSKRRGAIKYVVLHSTDGTNSLPWLSKWDRSRPQSKQNDVSIHYLVSRNGAIHKIVPELYAAWHVGTCRMPDGSGDGNDCSIGIEFEHKNEPDYPEVQLRAGAELLADILKRNKIEQVVAHKDVAIFANGSKGRKSDPANFPDKEFWTYVFAYGASFPVEYSSKSSMLASPEVANIEGIIDFIWTRVKTQKTPGVYTRDDVAKIVYLYQQHGAETGIDWIFALAQMAHETGWLSSWWSQPPRHNPAGIGVTGQKVYKAPTGADASVYVQRGAYWSRGLSFTDWDHAVRQHLGRLLCYAFASNSEMTPKQLEYAQACADNTRLKFVRGTAKQIGGLNGRWAVPGTTYAQNIARTATQLINAGVVIQ